LWAQQRPQAQLSATRIIVKIEHDYSLSESLALLCRKIFDAQTMVVLAMVVILGYMIGSDRARLENVRDDARIEQAD
jgi:hypothetical protein